MCINIRLDGLADRFFFLTIYFFDTILPCVFPNLVKIRFLNHTCSKIYNNWVLRTQNLIEFSECHLLIALQSFCKMMSFWCINYVLLVLKNDHLIIIKLLGYQNNRSILIGEICEGIELIAVDRWIVDLVWWLQKLINWTLSLIKCIWNAAFQTKNRIRYCQIF